jgi:lysophospholipase L1-like esterase
MRLKGMVQDSVAQRLVGTRFVDSPRAHALLADYANLYRFRAENRALPANAAGRVVFYGDSITDFWATKYSAEFFPGTNYLGRGILGQASREMVWRFQQDVIDLHPVAVVIQAGTNDIVVRSRHITRGQTIENLQAMVQAAKRRGIRVVVCSILPVAFYPRSAEAGYTQEIRSMNAWIRGYAAEQHITYLDYFTPMSSADGTLDSWLTNDGLHPNAAGYAAMRTLAQKALDSP